MDSIRLKEEKMKDRLISIFNALTQIETRGQSTLIVADCIRELQSIINEMEAKNEQRDDN